MLKTVWIAAAVLASSAASAQYVGSECRGQTLSEVARCAAELAPAPADEPASEAETETEEVAPLTPQRLQPRNLGGALQATNQRRAPPVVSRPSAQMRPADARPSAPPATVPLRGPTDDRASPASGSGRADLDRQRYLDPLAGTGVRDRTITGR